MPAQRDPRLAMARFLGKEAEMLRTAPRFVAEVYTVSDRLSIPLPTAVVSGPHLHRRRTPLFRSGRLRATPPGRRSPSPGPSAPYAMADRRYSGTRRLIVLLGVAGGIVCPSTGSRQGSCSAVLPQISDPGRANMLQRVINEP